MWKFLLRKSLLKLGSEALGTVAAFLIGKHERKVIHLHVGKRKVRIVVDFSDRTDGEVPHLAASVNDHQAFEADRTGFLV